MFFADGSWGSAAAYAILVFGLGLGLVGLSWLLGPRRPKPEKLDPYECGKPLLSPGRGPVHVPFYLTAIGLVLFDIEVVFLIPYAVLHRELGAAGFAEAAVFAAVLALGLLYLWKRRVLEWD